MGIQPGPSDKEEWRDQALCRFQKSKQELKEGQLPATKDGTHTAKGNWCIQDFYD
jgi:hypothetical protein